MYSPSITEYEDEDIPKIHLTAEEPPWDPSTSEYSEQETQMLDHWGQISIPTTVVRGPVSVSIVVSYLLAYDATDVMDNDNFADSDQRSADRDGQKTSIDPIVLAKRYNSERN